MNRMYELIKELCDEQKISIAEMCRRAEIRQGLISDLKNGYSQSLKPENLKKIASVFGVSVDYFLDIDSYRHGPPLQQTPEITDSDLIFALWGQNPHNMTEEDLERVRQFARYIEQEKKGE